MRTHEHSNAHAHMHTQERQEGGGSEQEEGMQQAELMRWYMDEQARKGLLESEAEAEQEMALLFKGCWQANA